MVRTEPRLVRTVDTELVRPHSQHGWGNPCFLATLWHCFDSCEEHRQHIETNTAEIQRGAVTNPPPIAANPSG